MKLVAPPWESVYVGQENRLFQETTLAVRYAYAEHGYLPQEYKKVADDHIALMMDFMSHLARKSHEAFAANDFATLKSLLEGQRVFIDEHLLNWIPRYAAAFSRAEVSSFYPCFVDAALGFFQKDRATLDDIFSFGSAI